VILFGADTFDDPRKGMHHLKAALAQMNPPPDGRPLLLVGFGNRAELKPDDFPLPVKGLGRLSSAEDIAMLYAAADVFVCPSREDNLPNTMVESLACGTPVTGFQVGGLMDLVHEGTTGSLAPCYDEAGLARSLERILYTSPDRQAEMRHACRDLAESRLTLGHQAASYESLYRDLLAGNPA
jgi:glycosyltransferase involved in cell wall biosynthesis